MEPVENFNFLQYQGTTASFEAKQKPVVLEHQMDLVVNGQNWLRFICSPSDLKALGVGFLFTENVISYLSDILSMSLSENGDTLDIRLQKDVAKPEAFHRTSTSVTVQSHLSDHRVGSSHKFRADDILRLYREFNSLQTYHDIAGGFHSASLCDESQNRYLVEDLGRHNCVDKLAGLYLLNQDSFSIQALFLSGRISSEMIAKSLAMQVPVIVSRTSPTALAIHTAEKANVTLIGYLRGNQFDIYSHPERLSL